MEKYLSKIQQKHYGIVAFVLTCIAMYAMLSYEEVLSTGRYVFLEGDTLCQYVPFVKMFLRDLLSGENITYSWSMSMGQGTALSHAYFVWNPFHLLYIIFPFFDEAVVTAMIFILKTGFIAWAFQWFCVKVLKRSGVESIVFSVFYAMCSFNLIYNVRIIAWTDALYMLPILCVLIHRLCKEGKWIGLAGAYAYLFITQFYMAYIVGMFTLVYMILTWIFVAEKKEKMAAALKYVGSAFLAVGLAAVIWLPTLKFLMGNNVQHMEEFKPLAANLFDILLNMLWGQVQGLEGVYPYIYCGIPTVLLCAFYFINRKIELKEKIFVAIIGVLLVATMFCMPLYQFIHAFDSPDMLGFRFSFICSFLMCAVACRQSMYLKEMSTKLFSIVAAAFVLIYAGIFILQVCTEWPKGTDAVLVAVGNLILVAVWIGVYFLCYKKMQNALLATVLILLVAVVEMASNGYVNHKEMQSYCTESSYAVYKDSVKEGVAMIEDEDFYRVRYINDYLPYNTDSWFGYNGISDFSSSRNMILQETMSDLGHFAGRNVISDAGHTPVTDMLLGVKYEIDGVYPYILTMDMPSPIVKENPHILSLGYMVKPDVLECSLASENVFDNMDMLLSCMTGEEIDCFEMIPAEQIRIDTENAWHKEAEGYYLIGRDEETEELGCVNFSVPYDGEQVGYVQFEREYYVLADNSPLLLGGDENAVCEEGLFTMSYAKELIAGEDAMGVSLAIYSNHVSPIDYTRANFCYYNENELVQAYDILSANQMKVREYGNGYVNAEIDVTEDKTVLFTAIPYDEGWKVYVDGTETETHAVLGNAFMALELEPGYHELEFEYEAPGMKAGIGISTASLGIYVGLIVLNSIRRRKIKAKEGNVNSDVEDRTE